MKSYIFEISRDLWRAAVGYATLQHQLVLAQRAWPLPIIMFAAVPSHLSRPCGLSSLARCLPESDVVIDELRLDTTEKVLAAIVTASVPAFDLQS